MHGIARYSGYQNSCGRYGLRNTPGSENREIFEPFVSTKEATSTGLGLWVTEGIVRNHHGAIRFRSLTNAQRHGTVFSLFLPFVGVTE